MKRIKKLLPVLMLPILLGIGACATAHTHKNPCNPCGQKVSQPCNPCSQKKAGNPCNPCGKKKAQNPCNPCNPCGKKK